MDLKVSPYPIPELVDFLRPFRTHFYRAESWWTLERYLTGLLADLDHKSGAGIAKAVADLSDSAIYRLLSETAWDAAALNRQRITTLLPVAVAGDGMLVIDETSFPRQGTKTVGVAHQYCGALGKVANCQVAVTTIYVDPYFAWPVLGQLYLSEAWCLDASRRSAAHIPADYTFQTKPELALQQLDQARALGIPFALVGADGGYGDNPAFLDGLDQRQLGCVVGVASDFGVRLSDEVREAAARPLPPTKKRGRPRTHPHPLQVAPLHRADAVLAAQAEAAWQTITWRQGSDGAMTKQFLAVRLHRGHRDITGPEGWLIGERPQLGQAGAHKYYWSNLAPATPLARLAELAHRRPTIERGYQDGKSELGLGDSAARLWSSFHRQLTIEMLALSWLLLQRERPQVVAIVQNPPPDSPAGRAVFPLRPGAVSECGPHPSGRLQLSVHRVGALVGPDAPTRCESTGRTTPLASAASVHKRLYLTIKTGYQY